MEQWFLKTEIVEDLAGMEQWKKQNSLNFEIEIGQPLRNSELVRVFQRYCRSFLGS